MDLYHDAVAFASALRGRGRGTTFPRLVGAGASLASVRTAVTRGRLTRVARNAYVSHNPGSILDRLTALLRVMPEGAAISHHTAAMLHGFGVLESVRPHIVLPRGCAIPQLRGVVTHEAVRRFAPVELFGIPCVPAARAAIDVARLVRRRDALPVLDAALHSTACTAASLADEVAHQAGLRGVRQARELVTLADPRPVCKQESQLRLLIHDHGLPAAVPQLPVLDEWGNTRFILDLGYQRERVGVEYDGASHLTRLNLRKDRSRHNWLELNGWAMRYATDADLYGNPISFIANLRNTLATRR
jgi:hypothetical protein